MPSSYKTVVVVANQAAQICQNGNDRKYRVPEITKAHEYTTQTVCTIETEEAYFRDKEERNSNWAIILENIWYSPIPSKNAAHLRYVTSGSEITYIFSLTIRAMGRNVA